MGTILSRSTYLFAVIFLLCLSAPEQAKAGIFSARQSDEIPNETYHETKLDRISLMDRLKRQIWAGWSPVELRAPEEITASSDYSEVLELLLQEQTGERVEWQPPSICGVRADDSNIRRSRIVAGIKSTNRWPWQVQLFNVSSGESTCGGTLVNEEYIITAAHCLHDKINYHNELIVRVGELDMSIDEGYEQDFEMECVHIHKGYRVTEVQNPTHGATKTYENDIALIKLRTNPDNYISFSAEVMPACLPELNEFQPGAECYVTGWGYTNFVDYFYDYQPDVLREARVPLIRNSKCKKIDLYKPKLNPKRFCAGYLSGPRRADTCKKDSGGPLVCKTRDNVWKLWGVTSEGENTFCYESPDTAAPGVYTRVDKYLYWLKQRMTSSKCPPVPLAPGARPDVFPPRQVRSPS